MQPPNRKPHLLRVRREIAALIEEHLDILKRNLEANNTQEGQRELAIWIREYNVLAKRADLVPIELVQKDGQGQLVYVIEH